ncbi:MAG: prepilin peptidase [Acidobacteria bacterium]|nr:prepilin peptidase [Acidobacteriota bacterium]
MIAIFIFLFGLIIGSFLNVCILRLPRHESVVSPRSRCPRCHHPIAAYDNIPLLSYLLLGGKCRYCQAAISPLYFLVELATGLLFVGLYSYFGLTALFLKHAAFGALLLVLTVTDWRDRILPDLMTFPGMAAGVLFSLVVPVGDGSAWWLARHLAGLELSPVWIESLLDGLLGAALGAGLLFAIGELYFRLRGREGMGFGDVKMMAMVGFFLGPKLALLTILLGSLGGSLLGLLFLAIFRKDPSYELPFGSFLGVAAFVSAVWGRPILDWYLSYLG